MIKSYISIFNFDLLLNQHRLRRSLNNFRAMRSDRYVVERGENDIHLLTRQIKGVSSFIKYYIKKINTNSFTSFFIINI